MIDRPPTSVKLLTLRSTLDFVDRETENSPLRETDGRDRKLTVRRVRVTSSVYSLIASTAIYEFIDSSNALPESHFQNQPTRPRSVDRLVDHSERTRATSMRESRTARTLVLDCRALSERCSACSFARPR